MDLATVVCVCWACRGYKVGQDVRLAECSVLLCEVLVVCKIGFEEDGSLCEWRYECNACVWLCFVVIGVCESA